MTKEELLKELKYIQEITKNDRYYTGQININAMVTDIIDFIENLASEE